MLHTSAALDRNKFFHHGPLYWIDLLIGSLEKYDLLWLERRKCLPRSLFETNCKSRPLPLDDGRL
jgi:hypothetical protein